MNRFTISAVTALALGTVAQAWVLDKTPDLGDFWYPLGLEPDTTIYVNSFVFNGASTDVTLNKLGIHLRAPDGRGDELRYFLLKDAGNAPSATILSSGIGTVATSSPDLFLLKQDMEQIELTPGARYWVAAQAQDNSGLYYQVGGHTQNSVQSDDGTFWYSNYNDFGDYDGQGLTPEMAIYVETVPEPATLAAMGLGFAFLARRKRK